MLDPENQNWLRNLPQGPLRFEELPGLEFVHGSPRDEDEYVLNTPTAALDFDLPEHPDVVFFGHTHVQGGFIYSVAEDSTQFFCPGYTNDDKLAEWTLTLEKGERYLINPGSVGQPRDNDSRAAFALYEDDGKAAASVTFYRVPYDIKRRRPKFSLPICRSGSQPAWPWADSASSFSQPMRCIENKWR